MVEAEKDPKDERGKTIYQITDEGEQLLGLLG